MRVFLYEWVTGGGLIDEAGRLPPSMLAEGTAMLTALAADFAAIRVCEVTLLRDTRLYDVALPDCSVVEIHSKTQGADEFARLAAAADYTLVVAPEFDGILLGALRDLRAAGGRSLNASEEFVALTGNKHRTAERLLESGVAAPRGMLFDGDAERLPNHFLYPAVLKPNDGAGSQHTLRVEGPGDEPPPYPWPRRLEPFCPGRSASVAFLCGSSGLRSLPPCWQRISSDGRFTYQGGATISDDARATRAVALAARALAALPPAAGYVGVDLVLGHADDGSQDIVIEVNPRVTTSYVGLRVAVAQNLAEAMIAAAAGYKIELTRRSEEEIEFQADGRVTTQPASADIDLTSRFYRSETKSRPSGASWLALDIGGANLKAADGLGFALSRPFPLWKHPRGLAAQLEAMLAESPPCERIAVTMTGELCDAFATKAEGVAAILGAVKAAASGRSVVAYLADGRMATPAEARSIPLLAAASNWHALATFAARLVHSGTALLIDCGSTTTDVIPLGPDGAKAEGRTDTERLLLRELVYTGVGRTPVCAIAPVLSWRGAMCPVAAELFATARDAYLVLDDIPQDPENSDTADGRPRSREAAAARLLRMVCADVTMATRADSMALAAAVRDAQLATLEAAVRTVVERMAPRPVKLILSGQGEFLLRRLAERSAMDMKIVSMMAELGSQISQCAPAHALAVLARERFSGEALP